MPNVIHLLSVHGNTPSGQVDRLRTEIRTSFASAAGGSAGAAVTTAFTFTETMATPYAVFVGVDQDAVAFVTSKTSAGFSVTLRPRLATNTLAAGSNDILVVG